MGEVVVKPCLYEAGSWVRLRFRPLTSGLLATACTVLALTGCGRGVAESPGSVTLNIWSMWSGGEEEAFQTVLDRYHELNPGVRIRNLGGIRDDTKAIRAIVAGVPPDIYTLADPFYLGPLAAQGGLLPLDSTLAEAGLREEQFVPAALSQCRYRGKLYAMPYLLDVYALLYNRKLFEDAGLDPDRPPRTLEELEEYAVKLTKFDSAGDLTQLGLSPLSNRSFYAGEVHFLFPLFGGSHYDAGQDRVTPDHPRNVFAIEWFASVVDKMGGFRKVNSFAAGFGQPQGGNNPFFQGKIAMMINGQWNTYWSHLYAPDLDFDVAPIPFPKARPEMARFTWFGGNMFCIPKGAKNTKEAKDFLIWTQTEEAQVLFASTMHGVPNLRSALRANQLRAGKPYRAKFAKYMDLAETPNGFHFPALPVANLYSTQLGDAWDFVLEGRKSAKQALADVRLRVQRELERFE